MALCHKICCRNEKISPRGTVVDSSLPWHKN